MKLSKITLAFVGEDKHLENAFLSEYNRKSLDQTRMALVLATAFYIIFGVLDFLLLPSSFLLFWFIRFFVVCPVFLFIIFLSFTRHFERFYQELLGIFIIIAGIGILAMISFAPSPENETYYAGLILVFMFGYLFIKTRFIYATLTCWSIFLLYEVIIIIWSIPMRVIITNSFVCLGINVIGAFICYSMEYAERRNFYLAYQLLGEQKKVKLTNTILMHEKEMIELIIETISDGVAVINVDGSVVMVNRALKEKYKQIFSREFPIDVNIIHEVSDSFLEAFQKLFVKKINSTTSSEVVPDVFLHFLAAFGSNQASSFGAIIEVRDISSLVKFDELQKQFVSIASHELRTPLSVIIQSISNFLKYKQKLDDETKEHLLNTINSNAEVMLLLIEDLLILSRIDENKTKLDISYFSSYEIVKEVVDQLQPQAKEKGVLMSINIDKSLFLHGDRQKISQVLRILIDNAIKYSNSPGNVEILSSMGIFHASGNSNNSSGNEGVFFYVVDDGCGIPKKDIPYLFRRFFRSDKVHDIKGTGLGLSIAKELITLHNGKIEAESEVGVGTRFSFFLPLSDIDDLMEQ